MDKRKLHRFSVKLPLQYWDAYNSSKKGVLGNVSETGLLIYSVEDMRVGTELKVRVHFSLGHNFESFEAFGKIIWKRFHYEQDWKRYKYGFKFVQISREDQEKLRQLLLLLQSKSVYSLEEGRPRKLEKWQISEHRLP